MRIVNVALSRPYTFIVLALLLASFIHGCCSASREATRPL
jgi:hypothetical protein